MAKQVRKPPSPSDAMDPRSREYFDADLYEQHRLVGVSTIDIGNIASGAQTSITIPVNGALANRQQTVEYGLPSNWSGGLAVSSAFVSADGVVTMVIKNETGSPIDMPIATYGVRVRP